MNQLLKQYTIAVRHPDASGFEHLDMLMMRDRLAATETELNAVEKAELAGADQQLLASAEQFHAELARITDLAAERKQRQVSTQRWWWYLDVLRNLPLPLSSLRAPAQP